MKKILISITILLSCKTSLADMWEEAYNPLYYNYNENYIKENKEFTVVSIGDSYASGEGLPDKDVSLRKIGRAKCKAIKASDALDFITSGDTLTYLGEKTYDIPIKQALTISGDIWNGTNKVLGELIAFLTFQQTKPVGTSAKWVNNFAHRSLNNAPAIAIIKKLPKKNISPKFFTFAYSGAETERGLIKSPKNRWKPMSSEKIKDKVKKDVRIFRSMFNNNRHSYYPSSKVVDKYAKSQTQSYIRLNNSFSSQIDLAAQALGKKRIDALIISSGGNDIGFSQVLENLYIKPGQLSADEILGASEKIKHARKNLENLNIEISKKLNVNKIYITEYPVRMFDDDNGKIRNGCGFINDRAFKVSTKEATRFVSVGRELNKMIKDTSKNLGWNYIGGIDEQFKGHGYCSTDSYFISATRSCKKQYDLRGMMHPNEKGVNAMADRISDVIYKNLIGEKAAKIISIL